MNSLLPFNVLAACKTEINWYHEPRGIEQWIIDKLNATKVRGLRPLLILNSNQGAPCPYVPVTQKVAADAQIGANTVQLDGTSDQSKQRAADLKWNYFLDHRVVEA